ncbi:MAG: SDR family oxidoreductase [Vampirovibrionales bacterium]|nr:SDR family oxidoreductase [Vampirovibrionales bacterium]
MEAPPTPKSCLIIGASGGIGKSLVEHLHSLHPTWPLVLAGRNYDSLKETFPCQPQCYSVDATDADAVSILFKTLTETHGAIGSVVHLVGSILLKPAHTTKPEEWDATILQNLTSAFNVVRGACKSMMPTGGGSIVLMSSAAARIGLPNHDAIAAAKAGVIGLTLSAAATYAKKGIRINCVAPGLVDTPLAAKLLSNPASRSASEAMHPLGQIIAPEQVAQTIGWLLSTSNVTGQIIGVDGGLASLKVSQ